MIILDTETTGVKRDSDRIIELALLCDGSPLTWRMNPGMPIPAEATAVHGITDADVADCAGFAALWPDIFSHLGAATVIVGFNLRFDLEMLQAELTRAGLPLFDLSRVTLRCAMRYWQHHEPRTLSAAVEKFLGRPHTGAHGAAADVRATRDVFEAMQLAFGSEMDVSDPLPERHAWCGPTDDLVWRDGLVILNFGKHKGTPIHELRRDYLEWVVKNAHAGHVRATARLAMTPEKFLERVRNRRAA